jgi:hypothetical protein
MVKLDNILSIILIILLILNIIQKNNWRVIRKEVRCYTYEDWVEHQTQKKNPKAHKLTILGLHVYSFF